MNEENQASQTTTDQSTGVETSTQNAVVDYEAKFHDEVKSSKSYRQRAQNAEAEIAKFRKDTDKVRKTKMQEDGKLNEVIEEHKKDIEALKVKADRGDELLKTERERLLNKLPEGDREDFSDLPLNALNKVVSKLSVAQTSNEELPAVKGAVKAPAFNKPWAEMTEKERRDYHASLLSKQ